MNLILPQLSEADPTLSGEGSLDPLGMAPVAERLAELLLPGLRARMRRVRFLTVSAVGALASESLVDVLPVDRVSTPSVCFEWLVLEGFARRANKSLPLEASGIPGAGKVRGVLAQGERLAARNYLKSPNVFGFTGVYLPLARQLKVLDEDRRVGPSLADLTRAWERDRALVGFTDANNLTAGGRLRVRLRDGIRAALVEGRCATPESSDLWGLLRDHLHPTKAGASEKALLRGWLVDERVSMRAELARFLDQLDHADEGEVLKALLASRLSGELRRHLEAIAAYEAVAHLLDAAFTQLRHLSTRLGTRPLVVTALTADELLSGVCARLPAAIRHAADCLAQADGSLSSLFILRFGRFDRPVPVADFVELVLTHHEAVQALKPPRGKRPWFDRHGSGWVVRSLYWQQEAGKVATGTLVHPYRLNALHGFMKDLAP